MARYLVDIGLWDPNSRCSSDADADVEVVRIRDRFRDVLDPDTNQTNWQVSDVFRWEGRSNYVGYGFIVFLMDGGAPSSRVGPAWLFTYPGFAVSTSETEHEDMFSGTISDFYRNIDGGTTFGTDGGVAIHYHPTGGTVSPYGAGLNADGSLPGGDLDTPATNPWDSGIASFISAGSVYGYVADGAYGGTSNQLLGSRMVYIFDDVKPFVVAYMSLGEVNVIGGIMGLGDVIVPYRAGDTFTTGSFGIGFNTSAALVADTHYVMDDGGVVLLMEDNFDTDFTQFNVPFEDGRYPWDVVTLASATYYKGYLDSDVVRVMGATERQLYTQFDGGLFIKLHDQLCFPYALNQPSFPYPDPTGIP